MSEETQTRLDGTKVSLLSKHKSDRQVQFWEAKECEGITKESLLVKYKLDLKKSMEENNQQDIEILKRFIKNLEKKQ